MTPRVCKSLDELRVGQMARVTWMDGGVTSHLVQEVGLTRAFLQGGAEVMASSTLFAAGRILILSDPAPAEEPIRVGDRFANLASGCDGVVVSREGGSFRMRWKWHDGRDASVNTWPLSCLLDPEKVRRLPREQPANLHVAPGVEWEPDPGHYTGVKVRVGQVWGCESDAYRSTKEVTVRQREPRAAKGPCWVAGGSDSAGLLFYDDRSMALHRLTRLIRQPEDKAEPVALPAQNVGKTPEWSTPRREHDFSDPYAVTVSYGHKSRACKMCGQSEGVATTCGGARKWRKEADVEVAQRMVAVDVQGARGGVRKGLEREGELPTGRASYPTPRHADTVGTWRATVISARRRFLEGKR